MAYGEEDIFLYTSPEMVLDNIKNDERIIFARNPSEITYSLRPGNTVKGKYEIVTDPIIFIAQNPGGPATLVYKPGTSEKFLSNDANEIRKKLYELFNQRYLGFGLSMNYMMLQSKELTLK